ncbi:putative f-box domain containing protein [Eutypa lata UCREL1]|uniref:Putative f-box domain containing protein n=1 Tax=Eutypa lata (strain UCR-EL1) TaxID=1287681 RepID=M7TFD5_EUTLA|nr:putative f-box domain containing protein [Eutypa lata UCREL1]
MERAQRRAAIIRPLASLPTPPVAASAEAVAGLGRLAVLPNEGVMIVLQHCSLQTLSRARLVNKAFDLMVRLLPDYRYVVHTVGGIMRRARPNYRVVMAKLEAILTFKGLRHLLLSHTCEKCGQGGGSFRLVKVKVLCDECVRGPRHELRVVR